MRYLINLFCITLVLVFSSLGHAQEKSKNDIKKGAKMDIMNKLNNEQVKKAVQALQDGNLKLWLDCFTPTAKLTDDGSPRDFNGFSKEALGNEKFISIDKVENDGHDIYGKLETKKWGTFNVFFKFHSSKDGKFDRLDIGQAK